jgi:hypothetical protein
MGYALSIEYTIIIIGNNEARVTREGIGYCESFHGPKFKADAIRYVKKVGGKNAKFTFVDFKYN